MKGGNPQPPQTPSGGTPNRLSRAWDASNDAAGVAFKLLFILLIAAVLANYFHENIVIRPISVPKLLSDDGFTDTVVSDELRQHIYVIERSVSLNPKAKMPAALSIEQPDIAVPTTSVSINTILDLLSDLLPWNPRTVISGAFTGDATQLRLTVLVNGKQVYSRRGAPTAQSADSLIDGAAEAVVASTHWDWAALYFSEQGRMRDADGLVDSVIYDSSWPSSKVAEAHLLRGMFFLQRQSPQAACDEFGKSLGIDPSNPTAYQYLSELMDSEKQYGAAVAEAEKAVVLSSGRDSWSYYSLGSSYFEQWRSVATTRPDPGDLGGAERSYQSAIDLWYDNRLAHNALGLVEQNEHDYKKALYEFDIAITMDDGFVAALENRGALLIKRSLTSEQALGQAQEDFRLAQRGATVVPSPDASPDVGLGYVAYDEKNYKGAAKDFLAALHIDPTRENAWTGYAFVLDAINARGPAAQTRIRADLDSVSKEPEFCNASTSIPSELLQQAVVRDLIKKRCRGPLVASTSNALPLRTCDADSDGLLPPAAAIVTPRFAVVDSIAQNKRLTLTVLLACAVTLLGWQRFRRAPTQTNLGTESDKGENTGRREPEA